MKIYELIERLEKLPQNAEVKMDIHLIGDSHWVHDIAFNDNNNTVYLADVYYYSNQNGREY